MLNVSTVPNFKRSYSHSKETQHVPDTKTNRGISGVEWSKGHTYKPMQQGTSQFLYRCRKDTHEKESYSTNDNGEAGLSGRMK